LTVLEYQLTDRNLKIPKIEGRGRYFPTPDQDNLGQLPVAACHLAEQAATALLEVFITGRPGNAPLLGNHFLCISYEKKSDLLDLTCSPLELAAGIPRADSSNK
jgi:hypothetical protein